MVTRILVLQEKQQNVLNIRRAVPDCELSIVDTVESAVALLTQEDFQLIISAVHLEFDGSVFDFLKMCKVQASLPFIFYCSKSSTFARSVRDGLQIAARALGAEKYITMEEFDAQELRDEIVEFLPWLETSLEEASGEQPWNNDNDFLSSSLRTGA